MKEQVWQAKTWIASPVPGRHGVTKCLKSVLFAVTIFAGGIMRAVIQRAKMAGVYIDQKKIGSIGKGIVLFLGIEKGDQNADADYLLEKAINLRIFEDGQGKMNLSLRDIDGEMLVISQFTLLGDCIKGRRPSFTKALEAEPAKDIYDHFLSQAVAKVKKLAAGEFQALMEIELINHGPVTLILDSRRIG